MPRPGRADETDWRAHLGALCRAGRAVRSPVIELNRAVAVGMAEGPQAGLAIADGLVHEPALKTYHLLEACAATCCTSSAAYEEARAAFEAAAALAGNRREQDLLKRRAAAAGPAETSP